MKFGVVLLHGSNYDHDTYHVLKSVLGEETVFFWHQDTDLEDVDTVILPGGFSYGDYLRCGAIAKFSPILESVRRHAQEGKLVVGICNGFQILQEAGLLPGVMLRNAGLKFVCRHVWLRTENNQTPFTNACQEGQVLRIPIATTRGISLSPIRNWLNFRRTSRLFSATPMPTGTSFPKPIPTAP